VDREAGEDERFVEMPAGVGAAETAEPESDGFLYKTWADI